MLTWSEQCRTRRTRCDQGRPCSNCRARGDDKVCTLLTNGPQTSQEAPAAAETTSSTQPAKAPPPTVRDIKVPLQNNTMAQELSMSLFPRDDEIRILQNSPVNNLGGPPVPYPQTIQHFPDADVLPTEIQGSLAIDSFFNTSYTPSPLIARGKFRIDVQNYYLFINNKSVVGRPEGLDHHWKLRETGFPPKQEAALLARFWVDAGVKMLNVGPGCCASCAIFSVPLRAKKQR
ncbi:hypothetical protein BT69DRAFT_521084 [Atractiella rhizophila]|nr:hypothetical protein BT69DRAFT_521084 [Atractiella rhizophila]